MSHVVQVFCLQTRQVSSLHCLTFVDKRIISIFPYLIMNLHYPIRRITQ